MGRKVMSSQLRSLGAISTFCFYVQDIPGPHDKDLYLHPKAKHHPYKPRTISGRMTEFPTEEMMYWCHLSSGGMMSHTTPALPNTRLCAHGWLFSIRLRSCLWCFNEWDRHQLNLKEVRKLIQTENAMCNGDTLSFQLQLFTNLRWHGKASLKNLFQ